MVCLIASSSQHELGDEDVLLMNSWISPVVQTRDEFVGVNCLDSAAFALQTKLIKYYLPLARTRWHVDGASTLLMLLIFL